MTSILPNTKNALRISLAGAFSLILVSLLLFLSAPGNFLPSAYGLNNTPTANYENVTVWTRINVTNAKPEILSLIVADGGAQLVNVTLTAGGLHYVYCNATIRDWNGMNENITVNATLFANGTAYNVVDDNNTHYTNTSCFNITGAYGQNGVYKNYTCGFGVYYYSNPGAWNCTVDAYDIKDNKNYTVLASNSTFFARLFALNITDGLDYGEIGVGEFSNTVVANVTNFGNMPLNFSVQGYGKVINDGNAFVCNTSVSVFNISIGDEAFTLNFTDTNFTDKIALSGAVQLVPNITLPKQTVPGTYVVNSTAWQVYIPPTINPSGECIGNVIFMAKQA